MHSYDSSRHPRDEGIKGGGPGNFSTEPNEVQTIAPSLVEKGCALVSAGSTDWFSGRWSCKGGDWKRNDEVGQDRCFRRKLVLNEGYPLCEMPKGVHEDPRILKKDDLYHPLHVKKLDLPSWAFSSTEENIDSTSETSKGVVRALRGVKGTILPVVRINACVVKDQTSLEPRMKFKGSDWHPLRSSSRSHSMASDKGSVYEGSSRSRKHHEYEVQSLNRCRTVLNVPKDHVCTVDELSINLGKWYYLDGAGREHGPLSYSELQDLIAKGIILEQSSVFRKIDNTWIPVSRDLKSSEGGQTGDFHSLHPQFIGYTRGKLHELVMKSYKNREFAAAINEVLDPWIMGKQPKKEMETLFPYNSSISMSSSVLANDLSVDNFLRSGRQSLLLVIGCSFYFSLSTMHLVLTFARDVLYHVSPLFGDLVPPCSLLCLARLIYSLFDIFTSIPVQIIYLSVQNMNFDICLFENLIFCLHASVFTKNAPL